jgi:osmotically-inducible protein OsmY
VAGPCGPAEIARILIEGWIIMKTNTQLQKDVMEELKWEPCVTATEIGVSVNNGAVTLSGTVPTVAEKLAAERATRRVAGVKAIAEEIHVTPLGMHKRSDQEIAEAAGRAIRSHVWVPPDVQVTVENSLLTLRGEVSWEYQRSAAIEAVRYLAGVTGVSNLIGIKPTANPTDLKNTIERAFARNAEIDSEHIKVRAEGGKVTLFGSAQTWFEREEAARVAWSAPGVDAMQNDIAVSD